MGSIVELFDNIFKSMGKSRFSHPEFFKLMLSGDIVSAEELVSKDKTASKFLSIFGDISELSKFCTEPQIARGLAQYPKEWAAVPVEITGEYCCYDAYYTILLKQKLWDEHKMAYPYYITQSWAGTMMESYGLNWNDSVASSHEKYYIEEASRCLHELIQRMDFSECDQYDKKTKLNSNCR